LNKDKGFTLVEVIVALAVITIISGPLLQMFVTSSYTNRNAQLMDVANVVAVQLAEDFKADQTLGQDQANDQAKYGSPSSPSFKYYDGSGLLGTTGAAIEVESTLTSNPLQLNQVAAAYYPDFIGCLDSSKFTTDVDVQITNTSNAYEIDWKPSSTSSWKPLSSGNNSTIINNTLPIEVDTPSILPEGTSSLTIKLTNTSNYEAEFYIFNAQDPTTNSSVSPTITLTNDQESNGSYNLSYVPAKISSSDTNSNDMEYVLTLTVSKWLKKDDNLKDVYENMFQYPFLANKYIHTN